MRIKTKYFGEVEITEDMIIEFPHGVLGFSGSHRFTIMEVPQAESFKVLQDVDNEYVSFMIVTPWQFFPMYEAVIDDEELSAVKVDPENPGELEIYLVVTLGKSLSESTANLVAPILINPSDRLGKQFVLNHAEYGTRHDLVAKRPGD